MLNSTAFYMLDNSLIFCNLSLRKKINYFKLLANSTEKIPAERFGKTFTTLISASLTKKML